MKLAQSVLFCSLIISAFVSYGQNSVGIGVANPNKNAVLELISPNNNQGILIPKLSTAQRTASSFTGGLSTKENGLLVFDSSDSKFYYWDTNQWKELGMGTAAQPQDLQVVGTTLTVTGNPGAVPVDLADINIPQDIQLTGTTLKITNNPSATSIDLSSLTGSSGTAGGDLSGTYPNPAIANDAVTSVKIADGTIATADILDGTIGTLDIATGGVQSADILDQTVATVDIADNAITTAQILDNTIGTADIATGGVASSDILDATIVSADIADNTIASADILDGTIASADIADNTIASADILDNTVASADITDNTIVGGDIFDGTIASVDIATGGVASVDILDNTVASGDINDGTIVDADVSATAAVAVSKLAAGTSGQVLATSGTTPQWVTPSAFTTLINTADFRNLFAGNPVGSVATSAAQDNVFVGWNAGAPNSTGSWNVAMGSQAGTANNDGTLNVLIGWRAGFVAPMAAAVYNGNTFIGAQAGQNTTNGPNTFIGEKAGQLNTSSAENVFVGNQTGLANTTTGGRHTLIGYQANVSTAGMLNSTAIGYQAVVNASNKIRLGNGAITVIEGQVGFTAASDRRLKENILPISNGLDLIMKLKPVSYNMKNSSDTRTNWGFIAQDIEAIVGDKNAVVTIGGDKDRTLGLRYSDFVAPLVKAVQEQQDQITDLNNKLSESEKKYDALAVELEKLKKAIGLKADVK